MPNGPTSNQEVTGSLTQLETWKGIKNNALALLNEDDTTWHATVIIGYVTSILYLVLFFWFVMYQFSTICSCCSDKEDKGKLLHLPVF